MTVSRRAVKTLVPRRTGFWARRSAHAQPSRVTCKLRLDGELDQAQRARLADIAERAPVTLTLKQGVMITTTRESI